MISPQPLHTLFVTLDELMVLDAALNSLQGNDRYLAGEEEHAAYDALVARVLEGITTLEQAGV